MLRAGPGSAGALIVGALELPGKLICGRSCDWPRLPTGATVLLTGREGAGVAVVLPAGAKLLMLTWHAPAVCMLGCKTASRMQMQLEQQELCSTSCHLEELGWVLHLLEAS